MAVEYKDKLERERLKDTAALNPTDLELIKDVEDYIDAEIEEKFTTDDKSVSIFISYVNFNSSPIKSKLLPKMTSLKKRMLLNELVRRYEAAGWNITYQCSDDWSGDYAIFSEKK